MMTATSAVRSVRQRLKQVPRKSRPEGRDAEYCGKRGPGAIIKFKKKKTTNAKMPNERNTNQPVQITHQASEIRDYFNVVIGAASISENTWFSPAIAQINA